MGDPGAACVVGAGPAGIVTAKVLAEDGFDVTVYEKYDEVGGTWSSHRRYVNLNHQLGKGLFEFSDAPNDGAYECAESVQEYLAAYASRFGVDERIEFETEVADLTETADGWTVAVRRTGESADATETRQFDHVAVCCGFHHVPRVPDVPGREEFAGPTLHSSAVTDLEPFEDRRVVVVGGGKSAIDLCTEAADVARSTTNVFREANWMFPKKLLGGLVPNRFVFYSRFGEALLPRYYNDDCVRLVDRLPETVKDWMWSLVETDLLFSGGLLGVDEAYHPDRSLPHDIVHTGILPDGFADLVADGRIEPKNAALEWIERDGVQLSTGEFVDADVLVFATGFRKEIPFLDPQLDLKTDDGRFNLYRAIVPPGVDNFGVVGLRQTFNNILTLEITAHWLAAYFQDALAERPSPAEMRETTERRLEWQERVMPGTRGYHFGPYDLHAVDELLLDMGVPTRRTRNVVSEYLLPGARARRYDDLKRQRDRVAARSAGPGEEGGSSLRAIASSLNFF